MLFQFGSGWLTIKHGLPRSPLKLIANLTPLLHVSARPFLYPLTRVRKELRFLGDNSHAPNVTDCHHAGKYRLKLCSTAHFRWCASNPGSVLVKSAHHCRSARWLPSLRVQGSTAVLAGPGFSKFNCT